MATPKQKKTTEWTDARWHAFVVSVLRNGTRKYPPKYLTLNEAKTEKKKNEKTGRIAQHYKCAKCKLDYPASSVQVDHKKPVVGPEGFTTWDDFITRLFCDKKNLQVLCKPCHSIKTEGERNRRKKSSTN